MSPRTIRLHAGQAKTGTSTLQRALVQDRDELARRGITTWDVAENQSIPLQVAIDHRLDGSDVLFRPRAAEPISGPQVVEHLRRALDSSLPTFLISGEALSKQGLPRLTVLRDLLLAMAPGATIKTLSYVRRPDRHLNSYVQQKLKAGQPVHVALAEVGVFQYDEQIGAFFQAFGRENVTVRLMPELQPNGQSALLDDFASALDQPGMPWQPVAPVNTSMSQPAAEILDAMNLTRPPDTPPPQTQRWTAMRVRRHVRGAPFRLPSADVRETLKRHSAQFAWLRDNTGIDFCEWQLDGTEPVDTPRELLGDVGRVLSELVERESRARGQVRRLTRQDVGPDD